MFGDFFWIIFIVVILSVVVLFLLKFKQISSENNSLKKQLHHRVKNNMQLAYSLINLQRRYVNNTNISSELDDTHKRLATLSFINKAYLCENIVNNSISTKIYKDVFVNKIFSKYKGEKGLLSVGNEPELQANFSFKAIDIEKALPLGLIINELLLVLFRKKLGKEDDLKIDVDLSNKQLNLILPNQKTIQSLNGDLKEGLSRKIIYRLSQQLDLSICVNNTEIL